MATKICGNCKKEKDVSEFPIDYRYKEERRYATPCKECRRKYYSKEKNREYGGNYRSSHRAKVNTYAQNYRKNHREWYLNILKKHRNKEDVKRRIHERTTSQEYRDYKNQYRKDNYELVRSRERIREREYGKRPEVRIKRALRARLQMILKRSNGSKSAKMVELIGCTMPFLRQHLESLWREGMSWGSYGFGRGHWVIDHIVACEKFDLTIPEQQRACFHYTNLQPLWWEENAAKSDN